MQMKRLLREWKRFIKEDVQPGEFYPKKFDDFLNLMKDYEDHLWVFFDTETTGLFYKEADRKSTRLNSSHSQQSRMPSSA